MEVLEKEEVGEDKERAKVFVSFGCWGRGCDEGRDLRKT
jgi:hypothetical protein